MSRGALRSFYNGSRWLHIYLSTALFGLLVFFCVTGVVLNHVGWLDGGGKEGELDISVPPQWQALAQSPPQLIAAVGDYLCQQHNLEHPRAVEWSADDAELVLDYALPAGYALATLDLQGEVLLLEYHKGSWLGVWSDLHKGRHSGLAWSWVIDISAVLMLLFALTGLIILWQNRGKRRSGMLAAVLGALTPVLIYFLFVPTLTGV
ncbi:PepSY-associated TM helix domain-containing protein [Bowmanella denitrificans]|uniref:PepSY-associated TM helix domain-containing protein n=1 Tax=Bowmanella denitrificans TaxID=366582 RepID=A0ABP3H9S4_9ALTE